MAVTSRHSYASFGSRLFYLSANAQEENKNHQADELHLKQTSRMEQKTTRKKKPKTTLDNIFTELSDVAAYRDFVKIRIGKITLGNSVIRVFTEGTKEPLVECLSNVHLDKLESIQSQPEYDRWHNQQVVKIYNSLRSFEVNVTKLTETGLRYGHATKILNIYIGLLVFYSTYFDPKQVKIVKHFLHVPLDSKVFNDLRHCSVNNVPKTIKDIDESSYYRLQKVIRDAALEKKLPPFYLDEYSWTS